LYSVLIELLFHFVTIIIVFDRFEDVLCLGI